MKKAPAPAPPRQKKEISDELVAIVKKKVSAPMGARPAGLMPFKGPKKYEEETEKDDKKSKKYKTEDDELEDEDEDEDEYQPTKKDNRKKVLEVSKSRSRTVRSRSPSEDSRDKDSDFDEEDRKKKSKQPLKSRRGRHNDDDEDDVSGDDFVDDSGRGSRRDRGPSKSKSTNDFSRNKEQNARPSNKKSQSSWEMGSRGKENDRMRSLRDDERTDGPDEESEAQPYDDRYQSRPLSVSSISQSTNRMSLSSNRDGMVIGAKSGVFNFKPILHSTYRELRNFVMTPPPPGMVVRCYIEREKSLAPFFSLCADLEDGTGRELIVCKKVLRSMSSHYVFSLKSEDLYRKREKRSRLYLGKLRATNSSEYVLFDNGVMDKADGDDGDDKDDDGSHDDGPSGEAKDGRDNGSLYRQQMAVVHYNTKTRPVPENIRGMEVCIPVPSHSPRGGADGADTVQSGQSALSTKVANIQTPFQQIRDSGRQNELMANKYFVLHEKQSKYDPLSSCLVDFKGRANIASVKNFQLIESRPETGAGSAIAARLRGGSANDDQDRVILLQMGKATDHCFNLDFRAPLTMMQAFSIAIARFDAKLKG